jgi:thiamine biosynthesis lipoprotein
MTRTSRRRCIFGAFGALALGLRADRALFAAHEAGLVSRRRAGLAFGTTFSLLALHQDPAVLAAALDESVAAIRRVHRTMSLFDPESEVSRLNRDGFLRRPDPWLIEALEICRRISQASAGAFDVTIQPLWSVWAAAASRAERPSEADIARARGQLDWRGIIADRDAIDLAAPGVAITLNGIAQGFACDQVMRILVANGVEHALIDTGEFGARGRSGAGRGWRLGIRHPRDFSRYAAIIDPFEGFAATSGDEELAFTPDRSEHHILDPATGHSPRDLSLITVRAATGALADGLSTAIFVAGPDRANAIAQRFGATIEVQIAKDGARVE